MSLYAFVRHITERINLRRQRMWRSFLTNVFQRVLKRSSVPSACNLLIYYTFFSVELMNNQIEITTCVFDMAMLPEYLAVCPLTLEDRTNFPID